MEKSFVRGTWQKSRAFSPAVITEGGTLIWIESNSRRLSVCQFNGGSWTCAFGQIDSCRFPHWVKNAAEIRSALDLLEAQEQFDPPDLSSRLKRIPGRDGREFQISDVDAET